MVRAMLHLRDVAPDPGYPMPAFASSGGVHAHCEAFCRSRSDSCGRNRDTRMRLFRSHDDAEDEFASDDGGRLDHHRSVKRTDDHLDRRHHANQRSVHGQPAAAFLAWHGQRCFGASLLRGEPAELVADKLRHGRLRRSFCL